MIGAENSRHTFNQSDADLNLVANWSSGCSHTKGGLLFSWSFGVYSSASIGRFITLVLVGRHSIEKRSLLCMNRLITVEKMMVIDSIGSKVSVSFLWVYYCKSSVNIACICRKRFRC